MKNENRKLFDWLLRSVIAFEIAAMCSHSKDEERKWGKLHKRCGTECCCLSRRPSFGYFHGEGHT